MSKVWDILNEHDTVVLFDVDGTLTSYSYGEYHAHHELDFTPEFRDVDIYADCKRLLPMYNYIRRHGVDRIFCISKEPHGHETWKSEMLEHLYGIPANHCYYTLDSAEKPDIAKRIVGEHFGELPANRVVCPIEQHSAPQAVRSGSEPSAALMKKNTGSHSWMNKKSPHH